jgi:DNA gyrase/topoisomerase IV subunit A
MRCEDVKDTLKLNCTRIVVALKSKAKKKYLLEKLFAWP